MNAPLSNRVLATEPVQAPRPRVSGAWDARSPIRFRPAEPVQPLRPLASEFMADLNHFRPAVDKEGMEAPTDRPDPKDRTGRCSR